jgi:hypothetical protein
MVSPVPKQPDALYWFQVGCYLGCECAGRGKEQYPIPEDHDCSNPREPTNNDPSKRTFNVHNLSPSGDWTKYFPWRGPGFAKPLDSCGIASGFKDNEENYGSKVSAGFQQGDKYTVVHGGVKSVSSSVNAAANHWVTGGTAEVSFSMVVNHGGGYQYRLCPKDGSMDEACFEAGALDFATSTSKIRFVDSSRDTLTIQAVDVGGPGDGTVVNPPNKAWRRIPVPACACDRGSSCDRGADENLDPCRSYDNNPSECEGNSSCVFYTKAGKDYCVDNETMGSMAKTATGDAFSSFYDTNKSGVTPDARIFYGTFHEKMTTNAQELVHCGEFDAQGDKIQIGLQYYPEFIMEEKWMDGYGYYMQNRPSSPNAKSSYTTSTTEEEKKSNDPCRLFDGKPAECEGGTPGMSCSVYPYDGVDYCIKADSAKAAGADKAAKSASGSSYFAQEYAPALDDFEVVDTIQVPTVSFAAGETSKEYVLSWRWDCEQTPQIWTTCADITIHSNECGRAKALGRGLCDSTSATSSTFFRLLVSVLLMRHF